jgi:hypothetical protein
MEARERNLVRIPEGDARGYVRLHGYRRQHDRRTTARARRCNPRKVSGLRSPVHGEGTRLARCFARRNVYGVVATLLGPAGLEVSTKDGHVRYSGSLQCAIFRVVDKLRPPKDRQTSFFQNFRSMRRFFAASKASATPKQHQFNATRFRWLWPAATSSRAPLPVAAKLQHSAFR